MKCIGSKRSGNSSLPKCLFLFALSLVGFGLYGQVIVSEGNGSPIEKNKANWYLDTVAHVAYTRQSLAWEKVDASDPVLEINVCSRMVILRQMWFTSLYTPEGEKVIDGTQCHCLEQIVRLGDRGHYVYYQDGAYMGFWQSWDNGYGNDRQNPVPDTLQSTPCFCITTAKSEIFYGTNVYGWGMLGINGRWLIEPKFDAPFRFQNGFAEVIYYGQKRKINEKGEFVE